MFDIIVLFFKRCQSRKIKSKRNCLCPYCFRLKMKQKNRFELIEQNTSQRVLLEFSSAKSSSFIVCVFFSIEEEKNNGHDHNNSLFIYGDYCRHILYVIFIVMSMLHILYYSLFSLSLSCAFANYALKLVTYLLEWQM